MELFAVSRSVAIAYGIALWVVLIIGPATVTALKGQWRLFDAGFNTVGFVWWISAFRLARPESFWARASRIALGRFDWSPGPQPIALPTVEAIAAVAKSAKKAVRANRM
jgi:hypothetical protein